MTRPTIDEADLSDLLRRLIRIDSCNPPGREGPVAELLGEWLQAAGLEVELDRFAEGRANVVARWRGTGEEPALLLNGHLDTCRCSGSSGATTRTRPSWRGTCSTAAAAST